MRKILAIILCIAGIANAAKLADRDWVTNKISEAIGKAPLATREWVDDNFVRQGKSWLPLNASVSGPITLDNGEAGTLRINVQSATNVILRCTASDVESVPVGTVWAYNGFAWQSSETEVAIESRRTISVGELAGVRSVTTQMMYTANIAGVKFYSCHNLASELLWASDGSGRTIRFRQETLTDAEYAKLRPGVATSAWRILGLFVPAAWAREAYYLPGTATHGAIYDSLYIGEITYVNTRGKEYTFTGVGYTPTGFEASIKIEELITETALDIAQRYSKGGRYGEELKRVASDLTAYLCTVEGMAKPASWGIKFPLASDVDSVQLSEKYLVESAVWQSAVATACAHIENNFISEVEKILNGYTVAETPHECPVPPVGGWAAPGGCRCHFKGSYSLSFRDGVAVYEEQSSCPFSETARHDWHRYIYRNGHLVRSDGDGCLICGRCGSHYESEGAQHVDVPESEGYCGCWCRKYFTIEETEDNKYEDSEASDFEVDYKDEHREWVEENGDYYILAATNHVHGTIRPITNGWARTYTFTVTRSGKERKIKISSFALENLAAHKHNTGENCWCACGLYHEFKTSKCPTVCEDCGCVEHGMKTETYTAGGKTIAVEVANMLPATEDDHIPITAAMWGDDEVIPQRCGCACGMLSGWWAKEGQELVPPYAFHSSRFCHHPQKTVLTQLGERVGDLGATKVVEDCKCFCAKAGNVSLKSVRRYHIHRPGELCDVLCLSCRENYLYTEGQTVIGGVAADGSAQYGAHRYWDQDPAAFDDCAFDHKPFTLELYNRIRGLYPDIPVIEWAHCGCACGQHEGPPYRIDAFSTDRSSYLKKINYHVFTEDWSCECLCDDGHYRFLEGPGCVNVCTGCGSVGRLDGIEAQITADNWHHYHTTPDQDGCGCACQSSSTPPKVGSAKRCEDYGYAMYESGKCSLDFLTRFHKYDEIDGHSDCECKGGNGPHAFRRYDGYCRRVCDVCTNKVDDTSSRFAAWHGVEASTSDHTFSSHGCGCECGQHIREPSWRHYLPEPTGEKSECIYCHAMIDMYSQKFECKRCEGSQKGHETRVALVMSHEGHAEGCVWKANIEFFCPVCGCDERPDEYGVKPTGTCENCKTGLCPGCICGRERWKEDVEDGNIVEPSAEGSKGPDSIL